MAQEQANQQPDANAQYLEAAAEKARAEALKTTADTQLTGAKISNTEADTVSKLAAVEQDRINTAMQMAQALSQPQAQPQVPIQQ